MTKVGLLVIATNRYVEFVPPLYASAKQFFLVDPDIEVTMFMFTNMPGVDGVVRIQQEHEKWPAMTLKRYGIFYENREALSEMDYLYYCDADMLFVNHVGKEVLGERVGTIHPGYWHLGPNMFTYERNPNSTAYIPMGEGKHYFAGGFSGGTRDEYLKMAKVIADNVAKDLEKGLIAIWHDESHTNRYFIDHEPTVVLDPSYCFPKDAIWAREHPYRATMKLCPLEKDHKEYQK